MTTWMKLEDTMLSKVSQSQKDIYRMISLKSSKTVKSVDLKSGNIGDHDGLDL